MTAKRRPLIAGNWKMNGLKKDGKALASALAKHMKKKKKGTRPFDMLVCPPFTLLGAVGGALKGSAVMLGAQDCHVSESGAHTGDISPGMLKDLGCDYVIVGHSERRADHKEGNALVKAKAEAALKAGLKVIVCIGETLAQRDAGRTIAVNRRQLRGSLPGGATAANTVIAYEPVWAIGTGRVATPDQAQEVHAAIRRALIRALGEEEAAKTRILYGGSMKPDNAKELMDLEDVDGGLIGGASLKAKDFWAIAKSQA
jgi:triosephosphate isomerase